MDKGTIDKHVVRPQTGRLMTPYNRAQQVLMLIGGTAGLVAGDGGRYWADTQTPKKTRQRDGRIGKGGYGAALKAHFDVHATGKTRITSRGY